MLSFVKRLKVGKIETVVCRILRGTTVGGKFVKVGDVVEITAEDFIVLKGQGQAVRLTEEELKKLEAKKPKADAAVLADSAGNALTTR